MTIAIAEFARQQGESSMRLLAQRRRGRIGVLVIAYLLVVTAGAGLAGFLVDTVKGDYALIASGLAGAVLLAALAHFQGRVKSTNETLDRALEALAAARAAAAEGEAGEPEKAALAAAFHAVQERRSRDFFGRQRSALYLSIA